MTANPLVAIKPLLEAGREKELAGFLSSLHPADLAEAIAPLDMEDTIKVMSHLDIQLAADVLVELSESTRDEVARTLPLDKLTRLVDEMDTDDAADIVGELPDEAAKEVLSGLGTEDQEDVRRLLMYGEDTAGGIMQAELVRLKSSDSVEAAVDRIREEADEVGDLSSVFVVDDHGVLKGEVSLRDLLLARRGTLLGELITRPPSLVLHVDEDQETAAQKFQKYDVKAAPVVDSQNRLLGRITVDDIIDVVHEEADQDFYRLAGSSEEELAGAGVARTATLRLPWLLFNLGGGFLTSFILSYFEKSFRETMALVAFVPMVMGLSGAVGSQCATITVRSIAMGRIAGGQVFKNVVKEQKVSGLLAVTLGLAIAVASGSIHQALRLGAAVGCSIAAAILVSAFMGVMTPVAFKAANIDPALASGPVVTSTSDVVSLLIYSLVGTSIV
ncbi:MAG: magnesium transporter [Deltaproteobacteria bacterium]|jgi:magnesium transporter|nr:magnesium transporter [Deltaproteobacteria bacterium]